VSNQVYANGMEVACKAASGKVTAAFPDTCLSPPTPPAGPVPLPYPSNSSASDLTNGTTTVQITGKEVAMKDSSCFKKSMGDEAATKSLGMGVITHQIQGKVYFHAWSMDVKCEGANVPRHLDLVTSNHMSMPGDTPTWPYVDELAVPLDHPCVGDMKKEYAACKDYEPYKQGGGSPCEAAGMMSKPSSDAEAMSMASHAQSDDCLKARRCMLVPYEPKGKQSGCCPGQTGHHLVEAGSFFTKGRGVKRSAAGDDKMLDLARNMVGEGENYTAAGAPCICVEGTNQYHGTHGLMHTFQGNSALKVGAVASVLTADGKPATLTCQTYAQARDSGASAATKVFKESGCSEECFKKQLDAYHNSDESAAKDNENVRAILTGYTKDADVSAAEAIANNGLSKYTISGLLPG